MKKSFRLQGVLFFLILVVGLLGCQGKKDTVNYEPRPDPFPRPEEETFSGRNQPTTETLDSGDTESSDADLEPFILMTINFEFDQSRLTEQARALLAQNGRRMKLYPEKNIRVEGHCDERGTVEYNLALGERRAWSVKNYLISFGISANRIDTRSYGKELPIDPRHNEVAWSKNRRVEFITLN